ncbi:penicillin acylase family protein [Sphingomonas sp.]|uniref:penicillin acylase family protein n=1 Tax=Sphingomonas sp. TaxID=28214 RepID=UPI002DBC55B7|nr:penicillin acylase family protein [Sphingomonas sp.]HEU4969058.1 penicillin acylase family protein [Sphingomonas sp.]
MLTLALLLAAAAPQADLARWKAEAAHVTITRDDWGIAHVKGRTDADAVFGAIYAQAEDDFNRVERNYLIALGRQAEADGEAAIWDDLRARLYVDEAGLRAAYARSPKNMQALMNAWADGLNYFLATHPEVKPKALTRFEPWMALSFTEGSIGGDIERIDLDQLRAFYGGKPPVIVAAADEGEKEPSGSNGFAIAPALSADGHALLLINPHTSFFFRSELQMTSDEGLNAYGASTWGQFFIYQGFNPHIGWMHTSSGVDVVDEFAETIVRKGDRLFYRYGEQLRPVETRVVTVRYRKPDGSFGARSFTTYRTHHGPIVRGADGKWIAFAMMFKPVEALQQSWLRTKASDYASFLKTAELKANSSNNTIFADDKGEIAYLHPQFVPMRDDRFDYTKSVDGSDPATDWKGLTPLAQVPHVVSPPNGWVMNTNNWPYSAAGENSPRQADFPRYMDTFGENPRGIHATMLLKNRRDFTLPSLLDAAFDSYLPAFARLIPTLVKAYDGLPASDPLKAKLKGQAALLRNWDYRWGIASQPTSLAVFWGEALWKEAKAPAEAEGMSIYDYMADRTTPKQKLKALADASDQLERDFGHWGVAWGEINRFQRLTGDIVQPFDDAKPSIPVPFTSSRWGSLASFGAKAYPGTKRWYGTSGNSFVAVVDFGPRVRARAITAGGESGHPDSPHFNDEAERYTTGNFREVYFWPDQLKGHTERVYRPGE